MLRQAWACAGDFSGTMVLAMACKTMTRLDIADAFVKMGASVLVGWSNTVSISRLDMAFGLVTEMLLEHQKVDSTVPTAMNQIGPDPVSGATVCVITRKRRTVHASKKKWEDRGFLTRGLG